MHLGKKSLMINYFSNKNIRLISKKLNVELLQYPEFYSCTLILVTYDNRFLYNQTNINVIQVINLLYFSI
jgi:hypothetical protein